MEADIDAGLRGGFLLELLEPVGLREDLLASFLGPHDESGVGGEDRRSEDPSALHLRERRRAEESLDGGPGIHVEETHPAGKARA